MVSPDHDYGRDAQAAAEQHLEACWQALDAESEGEVGDWPDVAAPFCGCQTCEVREVLHAAWPHLLLAARDRFAAEHADAAASREGS